MKTHVSGWGRIPIGPFSAPRHTPVAPSTYTGTCSGCGKELVLYGPDTIHTQAPADTRTGRQGKALYWCSRACHEQESNPIPAGAHGK